MIFAFGGCALFATSYYVVQRTLSGFACSPKLAAFTFWGWHRSLRWPPSPCRWVSPPAKEYAELEWLIDLLITVICGLRDCV